jgi:S1-C subfamily serine protease
MDHDDSPQSTDRSGASKPGEHIRLRFNRVLVRAVVAAVWSDNAMAVEERDALSQLVDTVAESEDERDQLRREILRDVDLQSVIDEVAPWPEAERREVFDRCLAFLRRDRKVRIREVRFLRRLARVCGVGWWRMQGLRLRYSRGARWRLFGFCLFVLMVGGFFALRLPRQPIAPVELEVHPEVLLPRASTGAPVLDSQTLYEQVRRSAATILVLVDGRVVVSGSGVVIGIDRNRTFYLLTNRHVVYQEISGDTHLEYDVEFENGARFHARLDFYSRRHDLALLAVVGVPLWAAPVAMRPARELRVGQPVYVLGSPLGLRHTFTSGVISALRSDRLQTDATVHSGSSGGPLFDATGVLCGVVTEAHRSKDFGFAVYADAVIDMLDERRNAPAEE